MMHWLWNLKKGGMDGDRWMDSTNLDFSCIRKRVEFSGYHSFRDKAASKTLSVKTNDLKHGNELP